MGRRARITWSCVLILLFAGAIAAFGPENLFVSGSGQEGGFQRNIRQTHFRPERIVSANLGADQILMDLAPDRIWSVNYFSLDPRLSHVADAASRVPHRVNADAEQILALNPDLVVLGRMSPAAVFSPIEESGVRVFRFTEYQSIEGVETTVLELGEAVSARERAAELVETMRHRLAAISEKVAGLPRPGVLYYNLGGFTGGKGTFVDCIITSAGGVNLAAREGIWGSRKLSMEYLLVMDPDVVIFMSPTCWYPNAEKEFLAHPAVRQLRAFKEGRIFVLAAKYLYAPSHHVVEAVEDLARFMHPKAFGQVSCQPRS